LGEEKVSIKVDIPRKDYEALEALAEKRGYPLVSDFLRSLIGNVLSGEIGECGARIDSRTLAEEISKRLERRIADLINPFTGKIDEINRKLGELLELIESLMSQAETIQAPPYKSEPKREKAISERAKKPSAMDRLREQKIVVYNDVAWMKAPRKLFDKLEREGAVVLNIAGELVAVHPEYWDEFIATLAEIGVSDPDEVKGILESKLGDAAVRLFNLLLRGGLTYYDTDLAQWIVNVKR